jgi:hypothetical protein
MSNNKTYSDASFGVEKIVTFPSFSLATPVTVELVLTEDIDVTEIGGWVTTVVSGTVAAVMTVSASGAASTTIGTLTAPSGTAAGLTLRNTTITDSDAGLSGSTLVLTVTTSATQTGVITPYIKYNQVYQS